MTIDQISVFVENKPGKLVDVVETLGQNGIDLRAMSIADTSDFGILRLIVDDTSKALAVLREADCVTSVNPVLAVSVEDAPGSLAKVLRALSDAAISVEYVYAFITHEPGRAFVILRVEDNEKAAEILTQNGVKPASGSALQ
ncbi:ACT domain-containing protein [Oscillospiraceae bacterium CM]|nr:ACT domain-containing protein [Oscillospiraceae bacterium CM]